MGQASQRELLLLYWPREFSVFPLSACFWFVQTSVKFGLEVRASMTSFCLKIDNDKSDHPSSLPPRNKMQSLLGFAVMLHVEGNFLQVQVKYWCCFLFFFFFTRFHCDWILGWSCSFCHLHVFCPDPADEDRSTTSRVSLKTGITNPTC